MSLLLLAACVVVCTVATVETSRNVLVTGATGRTGKLLYAQLKARDDIAQVRALVRASSDAKEKARSALNCTKCDASEGIFYGDVTVPSTLKAPMTGVDTVAITIGVSSMMNKTLVKAVEFIGVENQVLCGVVPVLDLMSIKLSYCMRQHLQHMRRWPR